MLNFICSAYSEKTDKKSFSDALLIWIKKPHVANRRLCGAEIVLHIRVTGLELKNTENLSLKLSVINTTDNTINDELKDHLVESIKRTINCVFVVSNYVKNERNYEVFVRRLIPKGNVLPEIYELIVNDLETTSIFFTMIAMTANAEKITNSQYLSDETIADITYMVSFSVTDKKISLFCHDKYPIAPMQSSSSIKVNERNENIPSNLASLDQAVICGSDVCRGTHLPSSASKSEISSSSAMAHALWLPTLEWLSETLLRKICSWSQEKCLDVEIKSLRLVGISQYNEKYIQLKEKYGKRLVEMWTENTDPLKFVYEDIGIAAYLLVLWEKLDRSTNKTNSLSSKPKYFVDVGCGNGLLVYLLNSEGHRGYGVDVRSRKIWETLRPIADLREHTVIPSENNLFPDADWLIGNHSDELTPWIPVMAAGCQKSNCQYFLLPCCPWDFTCKFSSTGKNRASTGIGEGSHTNVKGEKYEEYLDFIRRVGQVCGFKVDRDTLRIPSTRRVCFVGSIETEEDRNDKCKRMRAIENYIASRCSLSETSKNHPEDVSNEKDCGSVFKSAQPSLNLAEKPEEKSVFKPRSAEEATKNHFFLNRDFATKINISVLKYLLELRDDCKNIQVLNDELESRSHEVSKMRKWNRGGSALLNDICRLFDEDCLKVMKSSCGGIQTVLKNCPDVFMIREANVSIRDWTSEEFRDYLRRRQAMKLKVNNYKSKNRKKSKLCFYYEHHPDGCPLTKNDCRFAHGIDDLSRES